MTPNPTKNKLTGPKVNAILARYAKGESANSLAKEYGVYRTTVLYHARKRGVSKGTARGWFRKIDPDHLSELLGRSTHKREIAARCGVSLRAVYKAIRRQEMRAAA